MNNPPSANSTNTQSPFTAEQVSVDAQKTTLVVDETVNDSRPVNLVSTLSSLYESVHVPGVDTIKDFLEKPTMIFNGVFQTTDVAGSPVGAPMYFPNDLATYTKQSSKLKGVLMYRADIEVTIKVNAVRFQQGRYFLRVVYNGGPSICPLSEKVAGAHVANLMTATSGQLVEVDLATQTSATIIIPFISNTNYVMPTTDALARTVAKVYLMCYDPLVAGSGDTVAQYSIWARLINISLSGNVVLQSKTVQFKELDGPISGPASRISKAAGILSGIPLLSSTASTVSWLSGVVSSVASSFGYSKPYDPSPPSVVMRKGTQGMSNVDGRYQGHKLSAMVSHEIPISMGRQRTDIDEMSFDFIKEKYAWIRTVPWTNAQSSGYVVTSFDTTIGHGDAVSFAKGYTLTPVDYLSEPFSLYRGGIKYKFKIPKTEFHSGRLLLAWLPIDSVAGIVEPTSIAETDNLTRVIWDIRESNECEIVVPYISTKNFTTVGTRTGKLYVFVLNELIAPNTVPAQVNILIEKAGAEDLEFAFPTKVTTANTINWWSPYVQFQSGALVLGKSKLPLEVVAESVGERVVSIRSLIKRFSLFTNKASGTVAGNWLYPFEYYAATQLVSNTGAISRPTGVCDLMSWFAPLYALSSGSVRLLATTFANTSPVYWDLGLANGTPSDFWVAASANLNSFAPVVTVVTPIEGVSNIEVPQYTTFAARSNAHYIPAATGVASTMPSDREGGSAMAVRFTTATNYDYSANPLTVFRAAADDFNFSVWNGTVPVILNSVA